MIRHALRRIAPAIAIALVASMALAAWEDCIGKGASPRVQMACCAAAHHDCGPADQAMKCCERDQPTQDRLILTELALPVTPPVPVLAPVDGTAAITDRLAALRTLVPEHSVHTVHDTPTYILTGTLLI